jgi:hypothetical protein
MPSQTGEVLQGRHIPAPLGENAVSPASALPEGDASVVINALSGDGGLKPRPGFREHSINVGSGEVRAIIPYHGSDASKDRLFATTSSIIKDCTAGGASPTTVHSFATSDSATGYGVSAAFVTAADRYLVYTDETNGYLLYSQSGDTWAAGSVTGVTAANLVFVLSWKNRLWFVERNSSRAWYMPLASISGTANKFDFGEVFPTGGYLVGLWSWTVDAGAGADDMLVAVSSTGDVVVYAGTDPQYPNMRQLGAWSLGGLPAGRRIATQQGGDILLLTLLGALPLSKLISGEAVTPATYETYKERPRIREALTTQRDLRGWDIVLHPDNFLLVNTPGISGAPQEQFAMSYATKGWSRFRGLDILSGGVWQGLFYFGTRDGRVCKMTGYVDNVSHNGGIANARAIDSFILDRFDTGGRASQKQVHLLRTSYLIRDIPPGVRATVRYDYNTDEETGALEPVLISITTTVWDTGAWDVDPWDNALAVRPRAVYSVVHGAEGCGVAAAAGTHMNTTDYCVFVGWDLAWEEGGIL